MSKVKCFACHEFGYFASRSPKKRKGKIAMSTIVQMEEMAEKFDKNFSLVSCLFGIVTRVVWFMDSGASHHMTGSHEFFTNMTKGPRGVNVKLGDEGKYAVEATRSFEF